jgi:hypothetical protein
MRWEEGGGKASSRRQGRFSYSTAVTAQRGLGGDIRDGVIHGPHEQRVSSARAHSPRDARTVHGLDLCGRPILLERSEQKERGDILLHRIEGLLISAAVRWRESSPRIDFTNQRPNRSRLPQLLAEFRVN